MSYEVLEPVGLPVMEERVVHTMSDGEEIKDMVATGETIRKNPGETISDEELQEAHQSEEQIQSLIDSGAIKEAESE